MRSYSYVKMLVDGKETATLDIIRIGNTFSVYEYDATVFVGSHCQVVDFINKWIDAKSDMREYLETAGHTVEFIQLIK